MRTREIQYRHHATEQIFRVLDLFAITGSLFLAMNLYPMVFSEIYLVLLCLGLLSFMMAAEVTNLYRTERGQAIKKHISNILTAWIITFFILLFIAYFTKTSEDLSRIILALWLVITPIQLYAWRFVVAGIRAHYFADARHFKKVFSIFV